MLAPWRSPLARALHRHRRQPQARYLQLATVTPEGYPANRTVVFRGFRDETNQLRIVTDARSGKIAQLLQQPWGEICWYFSESREQFRLFGSLVLVAQDSPDPALQQERQQIWQRLSDTARSQFAWPHPGAARDHRPESFAVAPPEPTAPLAEFCLLLLEPQRVDWLELCGEPQNRWRYVRDATGYWQQAAVNP
ncbi:MAG: pyridoxamine 5'-phosphate oxidase [Spirulinaceae cyanobacterium RM2_2_10]|nr:pyridoxamine 5'-phosphate oxidase [Spirulinaceae cyanobacterium SM2_1_0]NJO20998.1 pyridoxamine 5'-phosphate oxidase [Spirulinaceae cyanobacterium RM2_2_10]